MRITINGKCRECGEKMFFYFELNGASYRYHGDDRCMQCGNELTHQEIERLSSVADKIYSNVLVLESLRVDQIAVDFTAHDRKERITRLGVI